MLKDMRLAQEAAKMAGVRAPLGAEAVKIYEAAERVGFGHEDFSSVIKLFEV
jgi:3-hydroxyisobutyrate dehydrogenase